MKTYRINEIFQSIQGEGFNVGQLVIFVRFSGCNMKCAFCDTEHHSHTLMTAHEILEACNLLQAEAIVLTGGEPMLQVDKVLCDVLADRYELYLETNGSITVPNDYPLTHVVVSPKSPDFVQRSGDELKVLVDDPQIPLAEVYADTCFDSYFVQPIDGPDKLRNTDYCISLIKSNPKWRLSAQLHKLIGVE